MQQMIRVLSQISRFFCCILQQVYFWSIACVFVIPMQAQALLPTWSAKVTPGTDTNYFYPTVNVELTDNLLLTETRTLSQGQCDYFGGLATRICARIAPPRPRLYPGDKGFDINNPEKNEPRVNYGNATGVEGNPRVQLCAYEDPCDAGDPPNGNCTVHSGSPYHEKTPRDQVIGGSTTSLIGATTGLLSTSSVQAVAMTLGPLGVALVSAAGAILGAIVSALIGSYNHIVRGTLGCVDIPIAPLPPAWSHNLWKITYVPNPDISLADSKDQDSTIPKGGITFFDPVMKVVICKDSTVSPAIKLLRCAEPNAVVQETLFLNANLAHKVTTAGEVLYEDCKKSNTVIENEDPRTFCSRISRSRPHQVCVFKKATEGGGNKDILLACAMRPGWMPKPTLSRVEDPFLGPKLALTYPGYPSETINLQEDPAINDGNPKTMPDPAWNRDCGYLQQVKFCAQRACLTQGLTGECIEYDSALCIVGYDSPYGVARNTKDNAAVAGYPNTKNQAFNSWVYSPPQCFQYDFLTGRCLNYAGRPNGGVCCANTASGTGGLVTNCQGIKPPFVNSEGQCIEYVRNVTNDDYFVDSSPIKALSPEDQAKCAQDRTLVDTVTGLDCRPKVSLTPLSPKEAGMCIDLPRNQGILVKNGEYSGTYTVPENCGRIQVRLWGGGGAGYVKDGNDGNDRAGTSAAHAVWQLNVTPGEAIALRIGKGSGASSSQGSPSSISHVFNGVSETLTVEGGPDAPINGKGPINDKANWKWNNSKCSETDSYASCYIDPQTRDGIAGQYSGHYVRGPGGGNSPYPPAIVNAKKDYDEEGIYLGCNGKAVVPVARSDAYELPPESKNWTLDSWPYRWPGAGGCSFDDKNGWGHGTAGRAEIKCIGGIGISGQANCVATNNYYYRTKLVDRTLGRQRYFVCNLPATAHGARAPNTACIESNIPNALTTIERNNTDPPMCQNGHWD